MEILDIIYAWQLEVNDLVQFQVFTDEPYLELLRISSIEAVESELKIVVRGESLITGGIEEHTVDHYLEMEVMGA